MGATSGPQGPIQGGARRGFDAAYGERPELERRDLGEVGTREQGSIGRDDTAMKNPDGDLQAPASLPRSRS